MISLSFSLSLSRWGPSAFAPAIVAIEAILVAHLLFALPIILTPICLFLERSLLGWLEVKSEFFFVSCLTNFWNF